MKSYEHSGVMHKQFYVSSYQITNNVVIKTLAITKSMKTQASLYPFLPHDHNFSFSVFSSPDIPPAHHHLCSPKGKKEYCQGFIPFFFL